MGWLDRLQELDDRVLHVGRWIDELEGPADLDAAAVWALYDDAERSQARQMAAWRNVARDPHLALVLACLVDRIMERRERQWPWVAGVTGLLLLVVLVLAAVVGGSVLGAGIGAVGGPVGWLLQAELYDRARRRNLAVARAAGLR